MNKKRKRLNISISFTNNEKEIYEYAKNTPNNSYYIKKLIEEDMKKEKKKNINTIQEIDVSDIENMLF